VSDRSRSKLFGRPNDHLLVGEDDAPRIRMPAPPPPAFSAEREPAQDTRELAPDEEPSAPIGPLRIFVGPPSPRLTPAAPTASPRAPEAPPGAFTIDASGDIANLLGNRVPAPRAPARASPSDPLRTDSLELQNLRSGLPIDDDHLRTELPLLDGLPGAPHRSALHDPVVSLPVPGASVALPSQRGRPPGIPTAAARAREARARWEAEEANTRIETMPPQIFERTRVGAAERDAVRVGEARRGDSPTWDDPRFGRPGPAEFTSETTSPGLKPLSLGDAFGSALAPSAPPPAAEIAPAVVVPPPASASAVAPVADIKPTAAVPPPLPPKSVEPPRPAKPPRQQRRPLSAVERRRITLSVAALLLLALGAYGWRWVTQHPDALARLRPAPRPPTTIAAVPPADPAAAQAAPVDPAAAPAAPDIAAASADAVPIAPDAAVQAPPAAAAPVAAVVPAPAPEAPATPPVTGTRVVVAAPPPSTTNGAVASAVTDRRGGYKVPTGLLQVVCNRSAVIYVDNVRKGSTKDGRPIELPSGTHRVRVVAGGSSRTQDVRVDAGQLRLVEFRLR
jgi:hypothetical protein